MGLIEQKETFKPSYSTLEKPGIAESIFLGERRQSELEGTPFRKRHYYISAKTKRILESQSINIEHTVYLIPFKVFVEGIQPL
jgi:hypothetical protein